MKLSDLSLWARLHFAAERITCKLIILDMAGGFLGEAAEIFIGREICIQFFADIVFCNVDGARGAVE